MHINIYYLSKIKTQTNKTIGIPLKYEFHTSKSKYYVYMF